MWPLARPVGAARPEFDGDVGRERRRALCGAAVVGPERRRGGSAEQAGATAAAAAPEPVPVFNPAWLLARQQWASVSRPSRSLRDDDNDFVFIPPA